MKSIVSAVLVLILVILGSSSLFVVKETERAVLLQFGELVRADIEPGLHFKLPYVNTVSYTHLTLPTNREV